MRVLIQRSDNSNVIINKKVNGQIDKGFVVFVGFTIGDNEKIIDKMIDKMVNLRVFEDVNGKMNLSIKDIGGSILSISQFTLYADCTEGRRPSFTLALNPTDATKLYDLFNKKLSNLLHVETGIFGSDMLVNITNNGPVTIMLDSRDICKNI